MRLGSHFNKKYKEFLYLKRRNGDHRDKPATATRRIASASDEAGLHAWRITSGAAHGLPWMQLHEVTSPDLPMPGATAITAATTLLEAARVFLAVAAKAFDDKIMATNATEIAALRWPPELGDRLRTMMAPAGLTKVQEAVRQMFGTDTPKDG